MASLPTSEPLNVLLSTLPSLPRPLLNRLVERAIEHMDQQDGDPDLEDATNAEDEGITWAAAIRSDDPGCPVSDPDYAAEEAGEPEYGAVAEYDIDQRGSKSWSPQ